MLYFLFCLLQQYRSMVYFPASCYLITDAPGSIFCSGIIPPISLPAEFEICFYLDSSLFLLISIIFWELVSHMYVTGLTQYWSCPPSDRSTLVLAHIFNAHICHHSTISCSMFSERNKIQICIYNLISSYKYLCRQYIQQDRLKSTMPDRFLFLEEERNWEWRSWKKICL